MEQNKKIAKGCLTAMFVVTFLFIFAILIGSHDPFAYRPKLNYRVSLVMQAANKLSESQLNGNLEQCSERLQNQISIESPEVEAPRTWLRVIQADDEDFARDKPLGLNLGEKVLFCRSRAKIPSFMILGTDPKGAIVCAVRLIPKSSGFEALYIDADQP